MIRKVVYILLFILVLEGCTVSPQSTTNIITTTVDVSQFIDVDMLYEHDMFSQGVGADHFSGSAWSLDGNSLASGGCSEYQEDYGCTKSLVVLWDFVTGEQTALYEIPDAEVIWVAWSPDGQLLAWGENRRESAVVLFNIETEQQVNVLMNQSPAEIDYINTLAFSPDGQLLASGGTFGIVLWDVTNGLQVSTLKQEHAYPLSLAWSPDGLLLASGNYDGGSGGSTLLWDVESGELISILEQGEITWTVAFSPDGQILATGGGFPGIHLWDVANRQLIASLGVEETWSSLAWSQDGCVLASSNYYDIYLWDPVFLTKIAVLVPQNFGWGGGDLAWSPDGNTLASGGGNDAIILWEEP